MRPAPYFSVVIPFFQREPGLLRRAVGSVLQQEFSGRCQIIIVDDGSPVSAEQEIHDLRDKAFAIKLIGQQNAGVVAARNRALDEIDDDTDVVVFLDSDDTFAARRFQTIQLAFENGADFFFEDTVNPYSGERSFSRNRFFSNLPGSCTKVDEGLFKYKGNPVDFLVPLGAFGTNSMAFRWKGREHLRFATEYTTCEDVMFAARLLEVSRNVVFSTRPEVILGKGVNISRGADWGSEALVILLLDICRVFYAIERMFKLTDKQSSMMKENFTRLDASFIENVIVLSAKRRRIMGTRIARYLALRPCAILSLPKVVFSLFRARLSHS